jgi:hypothetical protein
VVSKSNRILLFGLFNTSRLTLFYRLLIQIILCQPGFTYHGAEAGRISM